MTSDLQGTTIAPQMGSWPSPKDLGTRLTVTLPNTGHATRSEADARPAILAMALPRFQARPNPRDHGATHRGGSDATPRGGEDRRLNVIDRNGFWRISRNGSWDPLARSGGVARSRPVVWT